MAELYARHRDAQDKAAGRVSGYAAVFYDPARHPAQKYVTLRTKDKRIARRRLKTLEEKESLGRFDPWKDTAPDYGLTLGDVVPRYLASQRKRGRAESTVSAAGRVLGQFERSVPAGVSVDRVEPRHAERFVNAPKPDGSARSAGTKRRYAAVLSHFFGWAVREGAVEHDPTAGLETPPVRPVARDYLTADDEAAVQAEIAKQEGAGGPSSRWLADWVTFAVGTGLRPGEQAQLRWNAVRIAEGTVTVGKGYKTKTGGQRVVQVRGAAAEVLRRLSESDSAAGESLVFLGQRGGAVATDFLSKALAKHAKNAEVGKRITGYTLRHTYGTRMALAGTPLYVLAQLMGTSVQMIERHYAHYQPDAGAAYVDRVFG